MPCIDRRYSLSLTEDRSDLVSTDRCDAKPTVQQDRGREEGRRDEDLHQQQLADHRTSGRVRGRAGPLSTQGLSPSPRNPRPGSQVTGILPACRPQGGRPRPLVPVEPRSAPTGAESARTPSPSVPPPKTDRWPATVTTTSSMTPTSRPVRECNPVVTRCNRTERLQGRAFQTTGIHGLRVSRPRFEAPARRPASQQGSGQNHEVCR